MNICCEPKPCCVSGRPPMCEDRGEDGAVGCPQCPWEQTAEILKWAVIDQLEIRGEHFRIVNGVCKNCCWKSGELQAVCMQGERWQEMNLYEIEDITEGFYVENWGFLHAGNRLPLSNFRDDFRFEFQELIIWVGGSWFLKADTTLSRFQWA